MKITDTNGIDILVKRPEQGQICQIKIRGDKGYNGNVVYNNHYFESTETDTNRTIITRWKADLWLPAIS